MFRDRRHAGELLATALSRFRHEPDLLVVALVRGGVPVAQPIADLLGAELDVCLVRKLGVPSQPELAVGALAEGGVQVICQRIVTAFGLNVEEIDELVDRTRGEIQQHACMYRGKNPPAPVRGRTVIVVDDALATGSTMLAAIRALRSRGARRIVAAIPVAPHSACESLSREADEVICLAQHDPFYSVGTWYEDFTQVGDREVVAALSRSDHPSPYR